MITLLGYGEGGVRQRKLIMGWVCSWGPCLALVPSCIPPRSLCAVTESLPTVPSATVCWVLWSRELSKPLLSQVAFAKYLVMVTRKGTDAFLDRFLFYSQCTGPTQALKRMRMCLRANDKEHPWLHLSGKHCRSLMSHADKERRKGLRPPVLQEAHRVQRGHRLCYIADPDISGTPDQGGRHHLNKDAEMTGKQGRSQS